MMELLHKVHFFSKDQDKNRNFFNREYYDITLYYYTYLLQDIIDIVTQYIPSNSLIILGGKKSLSESLDSVILYDVINENWVDLPPLPTKLYDFTSVFYDNKIYIMGGVNSIEKENRLDTLNRVDMFDFSIFKWTQLPNLNQRRSGYFPPIQCNIIEVFDPKQPCLGWTVLSSQLNIPRELCISVVFNSTIYVIGGYDGCNVLDSIEMYDSVNDVWLFTQNLNFSRTSAVATKDYIYVIGGRKDTNIVEKSDMRSSWVSIPSLPEERSVVYSTLVDNSIYVVGGLKKWKFTSKIFVLDLSDPQLTWSTFDMPHNLCFMSCISAPIFL